jgi:predicted regulator of Ras-like GTPase activity (Roadblock/LC7/MglB family)
MGEQAGTGPGQDLDWLLDDLAERGAQFRQAVILSQDGLPIAATKDLPRDDAERLSALAAGVQSLASGAGQHFGVGEVRQTIIELEQALLFVSMPVTAAAWPCSAQWTPTPARSPTKWPCW